LELGRTDIKTAAKELREAGLLYFQQDENSMNFQLQSEDGAKATSYTRAQPVPVVPEIYKDI
jgi:hypothetical protein